VEVKEYESTVKRSWVYSELQTVRNVQPSFRWGLWAGMIYSGFSLLVTRGKEPWTLSWSKRDYEYTLPKSDVRVKEIEYPKPDGVLSFDILENL